MKLCAKIISNLDKKFGLWVDSTAPEEVCTFTLLRSYVNRLGLLTSYDCAQEPFELLSKNPVLKNITTYLIEEASAEEEELLGQNEPTEETDEKDPHVYKVIFLR